MLGAIKSTEFVLVIKRVLVRFVRETFCGQFVIIYHLPDQKKVKGCCSPTGTWQVKNILIKDFD